MDNIKKLWEERGEKYGRDMRGVLPKSFPNWLNRILHQWMYEQVNHQLSTINHQRILDLGCGYGRVAREILNNFPDAKVYGVDLSRTYVDIFNKDLATRGNARVADIKDLPFEDNSFDVVFMITTLMYLTNEVDQKKAIKEIFRVLKPKGKFIFIERNPIGHWLFTLGGIITKIRGKKYKEIQSVSFDDYKMGRLIHSAGCAIKEKSGFPFGILLTLSLYISYSGYKK